MITYNKHINSMPPKKLGAPKKLDTEGSAKQVKQRIYMRGYSAKMRADIFELSQMELDCATELERIRKEKAKLIDELEKANKQVESVLKEATADKKPTVKQMNASSVINRAVKGKVAKNALTQAEKDKTFNILLK